MIRHSLAWKEYRESFPMVLLGIGFMVVYALRPVFMGGLNQIDMGSWQNGLYSSGAAVLFFISVVTGTMAYAVEEERNTLIPLMAKPLSERRIFFVKVGVRLGLLLAGTGFLAVVLLLTGSWDQIEPRFALNGPGRWLGCVALVVLGFGLGLYFGKTRRNQTVALLIALTLFATGWVLLTLTPLAQLFSAGPRQSNWLLASIRAVFIPMFGGIGLLFMAWKVHSEREFRISAGFQIFIGLAIYASVLLVVTGTLGRSYPIVSGISHIRTSLALQSDNPERMIAALELRFIESWGEYNNTNRTEDLLWTMGLNSVSVLSDPGPPSLLLRKPKMLRLAGYRGALIPPEPLISEEKEQALRRSPEWITSLLSEVRSGNIPVSQRMLALHLADVADNPENIEDFVPFMAESQPVEIRALAAIMLLCRKDQRGEPVLIKLYLEQPRILQRVFFILSWVYPFSLEARPVFDEWAKRDDSRARLEFAENYFISLGDLNDIDLIRDLRWRQLPKRQREKISTDQIDMDDVLLAWAGHEQIPQIKRDAYDVMERLESLKRELDRYWLPDEQIKTQEERNREREMLDELQEKSNLLRRLLFKLTEFEDPEAVEVFMRSQGLLKILPIYGTLYQRTQSLEDKQLLPSLTRLGEPGLEVLIEIVTDVLNPVEIRFQAAALLVGAGISEYSSTALELWQYGISSTTDAEENSPEYQVFILKQQFWIQLASEALIDLASSGNIGIVGGLIENAKVQFRQKTQPYEIGYLGLQGAWYWNTKLIDGLKEGTGQDYGWDLHKWYGWWNKSGTKLDNN